MLRTTGVWFPIGEGPVLDAAKPLLEDLKREREAHRLKGGYRIGEQRRVGRTRGSKRELEILFGDEDEAMMAKLKFPGS